MTIVKYVEVFDEENPSSPNPEELANQLQKKIHDNSFMPGRILKFICSNFLGTKRIPEESRNNIIYPIDSGIIYQYMIFFEEKFI